jgi:hypothetical protein
MGRSSLQLAIVVVTVTLLHGACVAPFTAPTAQQTPSVTATSTLAPVATVSPLPAETASPEQESVSFQTIVVEEIGLRFEVPAGWIRVDSEWAWAPPGRGAHEIQSLIIGVHWAGLAPPQEPEAALLPGPSEIVESEPVDVGWGTGRSYTLEVFEDAPAGGGSRAPVSSVETHVIIVVSRNGGRLGLDFYARADDSEQLTDIQPFLQEMLHSSMMEVAQ